MKNDAVDALCVEKGSGRMNSATAACLDRIPGKSFLDALVHEGGVAENGDTARSEKPENCRKWRGEEAEENSEDDEECV